MMGISHTLSAVITKEASMGVRRLRLERGWSQEQLALLCGLSTRTIQRIENGQPPALETLNSLAAVFSVSVQELEAKESEMEQMENKEGIPANGDGAAKQAFYRHLLRYVIIISLLFVINWLTGPDYIWAKWPALGWGIGILSHARKVFWPATAQQVA